MFVPASRPHSLIHEACVAAGHAAASVRRFVVDVYQQLAQSAEARQHARDEAYLAEAVDRYDLEYRMRELDRAQTGRNWLN